MYLPPLPPLYHIRSPTLLYFARTNNQAGAQKNVGIPGITILIIRKDILIRADAATLKSHSLPAVPIVFDYLTTVQNNSLYNTLPIFSLHIADLVFRHLLSQGGITGQESRNLEKATLLYDVLETAEREGKVELVVDRGVRSRMNVPFKFKSKELDAEFVKCAEERGMFQLKGHRSVGGVRASLYNAVTVENVETLVAFLKEFLDKV
jgi:phosphoserine aminotransferase